MGPRSPRVRYLMAQQPGRGELAPVLSEPPPSPDDHGLPPERPGPGEPTPQGAVDGLELRSTAGALVNAEMMAKGQDLDLKHEPATEEALCEGREGLWHRRYYHAFLPMWVSEPSGTMDAESGERGRKYQPRNAFWFPEGTGTCWQCERGPHFGGRRDNHAECDRMRMAPPRRLCLLLTFD
jgi:hypothetical protein